MIVTGKSADKNPDIIVWKKVDPARQDSNPALQRPPGETRSNSPYMVIVLCVVVTILVNEMGTLTRIIIGNNLTNVVATLNSGIGKVSSLEPPVLSFILKL